MFWLALPSDSPPFAELSVRKPATIRLPRLSHSGKTKRAHSQMNGPLLQGVLMGHFALAVIGHFGPWTPISDESDINR